MEMIAVCQRVYVGVCVCVNAENDCVSVSSPGNIQSVTLCAEVNPALPSSSSAGVAVFGAFLRSEFSEENLQFYLACEQYRHSSNNFSLQRRAKDIYATYIQPGAPREVQAHPFLFHFAAAVVYI